jgi:hypothetical protein
LAARGSIGGLVVCSREDSRTFGRMKVAEQGVQGNVEANYWFEC